MKEQWILNLSLRHSHGMREYHREIATPVEIEIESSRAVDELKFAPAAFTGAVATMKRRQARREIIQQIATQLGAQLADTIEDAAGWHGEGRMEGVIKAGLAKP